MKDFRNPFILGLCAPLYLLAGTSAVINDFLLAIMFILATLGIIGAYVTDFPLLPGLYTNEVAHKTALASLLGMLFGLVLFMAYVGGFGASEGADSSPVSPQGKFLLTWAVMSLPSYPLMVYFVFKVNKRDLEGEQRVREEKKKKRKSQGGGPPIMDRDHF